MVLAAERRTVVGPGRLLADRLHQWVVWQPADRLAAGLAARRGTSGARQRSPGRPDILGIGRVAHRLLIDAKARQAPYHVPILFSLEQPRRARRIVIGRHGVVVIRLLAFLGCRTGDVLTHFDFDHRAIGRAR